MSLTETPEVTVITGSTTATTRMGAKKEPKKSEFTVLTGSTTATTRMGAKKEPKKSEFTTFGISTMSIEGPVGSPGPE